jgi:hypothetical protein
MTDEQSNRLPISVVVEDEEDGILLGDYLSIEERGRELVRIFGFNQEILAGYLDPSSRRQYCRDFYAYLQYAGSKEEALRPATLAHWVLWLVEHPQRYSPKTINRMLSAVRNYWGSPPRSLCLRSTATQSTDADTPLWLLRATHQGTLTRYPSSTSLAGAGAFASSYSAIQ